MGEALNLAVLLTLKDQLSGGLDGIGKKFGGLGTAAMAGAAVAVAGVALVAKGLAECASAAAEEEVGIVRLGAAVSATGADWGTASTAIEAYLSAELRRTALDDGAGRESIQRLTEITGSYTTALQLMPIAQDMAASGAMTLEQASVLLGKATEGNIGALRRYVPAITEGMSVTEALGLTQQRFAGQAEAYAATNEGASKKLSIAFGNLKETIGTALLPIITQITTKFAELAMSALPYVERGIAALQVGFARVGEVISAIVPFVGGVIAAFQNLLSTGDVGGFMDLIADAIYGLGEALGIPAPLVDGIVTAVWGFITTAADTLIPLIGEVVVWFQETLPVAIETLAGFWNDTLLPALTTIGNFIADPLIGLWVSLERLGLAVVQKAVEALAGLWQNVLLPALSAGVTKFSELVGGLDGIKAAIERVASWFGTLAEKIRGLTLPSWLTPGSATPLETALIGIAVSASKAADGLGLMTEAMGDTGLMNETLKLMNEIASGTGLMNETMRGTGLAKGTAVAFRQPEPGPMMSGGEVPDSTGLSEEEWKKALPIEKMEILQALLTPFKNIVGLVGDLMQAAGIDVNQVKQNATSLLDNLKVMMEVIVTQFSEKQADWGILVAAFATLTPQFTQLNAVLTPVAAALAPIMAIMDILGSRLGIVRMDIENFLNSVLGGMIRINAWVDANGTLISEAVEKFRTSTLGPFTDLGLALGILAIPLGAAMTAATAMSTDVGLLNTGITGFIEGLAFLRLAMQTANEGEALVGFGDIVGDFTAAVANGLTILATGFQGELGMEQGVLSELLMKITGYIDLIKNPFELLYTWLNTTYKSKLGSISLAAAALAVTSSFINTAMSRLAEFYQAGWDLGQSFIDGLNDSMGRKSPPKVIIGIGQDITDTFMATVMKDIGQMFKAGESMGKAVENGVRDALDMHSPSRTIQGLVNDTYDPFNDPKNLGGGTTWKPPDEYIPRHVPGADTAEGYRKAEQARIIEWNMALNISGPVSMRSEQDVIDLATELKRQIVGEIGGDIKSLMDSGVKL